MMNRTPPPLERLPAYPEHCPTGRVISETRLMGGKWQARLALETPEGVRYNITPTVAPYLRLAASPNINLPHGDHHRFLSRVRQDASDYINFLHINRENTLRQEGRFEDMALKSLGEELTRLITNAVYRSEFDTAMPDWLVINGRGRELDGYSPSAAIAFEYQGAHHTTDAEIISVDMNKADLCSENGVRLLQVPHEDRLVAQYINEADPDQKEVLFTLLTNSLVHSLNKAARQHDGIALVRLTPEELTQVRETFDKMAEVKHQRLVEAGLQQPVPAAPARSTERGATASTRPVKEALPRPAPTVTTRNRRRGTIER